MRLSTIIVPILSTLVYSTHLSILIPASAHILNPSTLPSTTSATLTTLSHTYVASLSTANDFSFRNVSLGSYLLSVTCSTHSFAPLRVDVGVSGKDVVEAWATFRGNEWDNKGEVMVVARSGDKVTMEVRATGVKKHFMERGGFSPLSLLKNPMILIGGASMILVFGMPYLMDNMDPEMRAEFEATQKAGGLSGMIGGKTGQANGPNPVASFDAAAWLAGQSSKTEAKK